MTAPAVDTPLGPIPVSNRERFWEAVVQTATAMAEATGKEVFARTFAVCGQQEHVRMKAITAWLIGLPSVMAMLDRRDRAAPFAVWLMCLPHLQEIAKADHFFWFQEAYGNMLNNADRRLHLLCYLER